MQYMRNLKRQKTAGVGGDTLWEVQVSMIDMLSVFTVIITSTGYEFRDANVATTSQGLAFIPVLLAFVGSRSV